MARKLRPLAAAIGAVGMTFPDVAQLCGVTVGPVYSWNQQRTRIPEQHLPVLSQALGLPQAAVRDMSFTPVAPRLRSVAMRNGWTTRELAAELGVSAYVMRTALTGQRHLPRRTHAKLEELFDEPVERLLDGSLEALDAETEAVLVEHGVGAAT